MSKWNLAIFVSSFLLFSSLSFADSLTRTYKIDADLRHFDEGKLSISMEAEIRNEGEKPIEELLWILYPNRFLAELPNLDDLNYRRVYTNGFSRGSIEFSDVQVDAKPALMDVDQKSPLPVRTVGRIQLPQPLLPGQQTVVSMKYLLEIPEKYGSFGRAKGRLTMSGGWYPYLASFREGEFQIKDLPPRADWDLSLRTDADSVINGRFFQVSDKPIEEQLKGARKISLFLGKDLQTYRLAGTHLQAQVVVADRSKAASKAFGELVVRWLEFVDRHPELSRDTETVTLVQAPIREMLAEDGEGMTYVSDRAFKFFPSLRQYHTPPIIRGLFYQLMFPQGSLRESSRDYQWVTRLVAWSWTERFMRENTYIHRDARNIGAVKFFSFLPVIDQVIYAPQFAFMDVYYDMIYPFDVTRDDLLRFNHKRPFARTIYAHLEDEVGLKKTKEVAQSYLEESGDPFVAVAEQKTEKSLADEFAQWTAPRPRVNYVLGRTKKQKTENGFNYTVPVRRESKEPIVEPVELKVVTKGGERFRLIWNGPGKKYEYHFQTKSRVKALEIDSRGRLWETQRADNRRPPYYKFVLTEAIVNYDFNENTPIALVSTQLRRKYGGYNRYNFRAFYTSASYGGSVGYTRLFGQILDQLRMSHGLSFGFGYQRIDDDYALAEQSGSPSQVVQVGESGNVTTLSASYGFGNTLSLTNPLEGGGGSISASWGSKYLGGNADYWRAGMGGTWIFQLHPSHLLAVRGYMGFSGPEEMPSKIQYFLGGIAGIRGLPFDDNRFKGRNKLLTSAEYRHFLLQDIDINLWLIRVRDIQGALFTDAGNVTDTVEERAQRIAFGTANRTTRGDLFDVTNFQTDFGYGVRFHIEWLGINPAIVRFDVAKSLTEWGYKPRFYFGVTQSF